MRSSSLLVVLLPLIAIIASSPSTSCDDVGSPVVSFQYLDSLADSPSQPNVSSALVSYQYFDSVVEPADQPTVASAVVGYEYFDSLVEQLDRPTVASAVVSYQYFDWAGEGILQLQKSPPVSFFYFIETSAATIAIPPQSRVVLQGNATTFTVVATGKPPLTFQWLFNGVQIPAANEATYSVPSVTVADSGNYSVLVANAYNSMNSAAAKLTVFIPISSAKPIGPSIVGSTDVPPRDLFAPLPPTDPEQFKILSNGGIINNKLKTIVMTHGFRSSSGEWPKVMGAALKTYEAEANIIAWDWSKNAKQILPNIAAQFTQREGEALGDRLLRELNKDGDYDQKIHFIGHSLGTMVNCYAADYVHGDAANSPGKKDGVSLFNSENTHMTLFDEAELEDALNFDNVHVFKELLEILLPSGDAGSAIAERGVKVIPDHSKWVDNYISEVGLVHSTAANVLLWRHFAIPVLDDFGSESLHGYGYRWYIQTIMDAARGPNIMGFTNSFEYRDSFFASEFPPPLGSCFLQSLDLGASEYSLTRISELEADFFSKERFPVYNSLQQFQVLNGSVQALDIVVEKGGSLVVRAVRHTGTIVYDFVAGAAPSLPTGDPVFVGNANSTPAYYVDPNVPSVIKGNWDFNFTLSMPASPLLRTRNGAAVPADTSAFAWLSVSVPTNSMGFSFEYKIKGAMVDEYVTMGIGSERFLTGEAKYLDNDVWNGSGIIDTSQFSGKDVDLFFSLNGSHRPEGELSIRGIHFYTKAVPPLRIELRDNDALIFWPNWAQGWRVQAATNVFGAGGWIDVTNTPGTNSFENVVTNRVATEATFYRLQN